MTPDTTISVITRTTERPILLRRAIRSVLNQSHPLWTHIIVNDGGNAKEVESIADEFRDEYAGRLIILHHVQSLGREAASNKALEKCSSRYVVVLDDDDTWHPDFMRRCLEKLATHGVRAVACQTMRIVERIDNSGNIHELNRIPFNPWLFAVEIPRLCTNNTIPNLSLIFERSLIDEIGFFDQNFAVLGDWDFNLRLALATEIEVVPEFLAFYHQRPTAEEHYANSYYLHRDSTFRICRAKLINKWIRSEYKLGKFSVGDTMAFASLNYEGHTFSRRANRFLNFFTGHFSQIKKSN